jgi:hypothetical protein
MEKGISDTTMVYGIPLIITLLFRGKINPIRLLELMLQLRKVQLSCKMPATCLSVWEHPGFTATESRAGLFAIAIKFQPPNSNGSNSSRKASLLLGIDKMVTLLSPDAEYFPAYELLLDDLRDYRFYANDLLHPGEQGIAYIREKFTETYFDKETLALMAEIQKLKEASRHRVMNPGTESHLKFQEKMLAKISQLERAHPFLNLADIKRSFTGD